MIEPQDVTSVLDRCDARDVVNSPFYHLTRQNLLPHDLYDHLATAFPSIDKILRGRDASINNAAARLPCQFVLGNPEIDPLWRTFFEYHTSTAFWADILRVFGALLKRTHPELEQRLGCQLEKCQVAPRNIAEAADIYLDCQFVINTPVTMPSSVKTMHVDRPSTIFSGLLYFRDENDNSTGGELEMGEWRRPPRLLRGRLILPSDCTIAKVIPYEAGRFVCFLNYPQSIHAVSPRSATSIPRRYINVVAETPFAAFQMEKMSPLAKILHLPEIRRIGYRSLGGDQGANSDRNVY